MSSIVDINEIISLLPHRYPMLLIDKVISMELGKNIVAVKNVTINENFFQGHFPGKPIMPGVLIVEAMAQAAGVLAIKTMQAEVVADSTKQQLVYFMTIDGVKFRKPVIPGDSLHLHIELEKSRGKVSKFSCYAEVDGIKVAEATISAMVE